MSQASEFGSLAMATDQATRMLKIYKKKLINSKETVSLDSLEHEVSDLLKTVRERKDRTKDQQREGQPANGKEQAKAGTENDVDQLAVLLEGSRITNSPKTTVAESNGSTGSTA